MGERAGTPALGSRQPEKAWRHARHEGSLAHRTDGRAAADIRPERAGKTTCSNLIPAISTPDKGSAHAVGRGNCSSCDAEARHLGLARHNTRSSRCPDGNDASQLGVGLPALGPKWRWNHWALHLSQRHLRLGARGDSRWGPGARADRAVAEELLRRGAALEMAMGAGAEAKVLLLGRTARGTSKEERQPGARTARQGAARRHPS